MTESKDISPFTFSPKSLITLVYFSNQNVSQCGSSPRIQQQINGQTKRKKQMSYTPAHTEWEFDSVLKRKKILTHATTWINLKYIMVSY